MDAHEPGRARPAVGEAVRDAGRADDDVSGTAVEALVADPDQDAALQDDEGLVVGVVMQVGSVFVGYRFGRDRGRERDNAQRLPELGGLVAGQGAQEEPFCLGTCAGGRPEGGTARAGQGHDVLSPVARVLPPLDEPLVLQFVDQQDHRGPVDPQPACDLLLGERRPAVNRDEHGELPPGDPEGRHGRARQLGQPQLRVLEQIAKAAGQRWQRLARGRLVIGTWGRHGAILWLD